MPDLTAHFQPASDQTLLISFADKICPAASLCVRRLIRLLETNPVAGVANLHPAYCSVLIRFDALLTGHSEIEALLRPHLDRLDDIPLPEAREVEIPVCYGGEFGVDLADLAEMRGMTPAQVAALHSSAAYTVDFLGFAPGFGYLSGLPDELATARLPVPRRSVPAGSVGIAGNQTAVYPFSTAGGWRLIGRTPVAMFSPDRQPMSLLSIGDRVRFRAISAEEFGG